MNGKFIVIEGLEGAGKTTALQAVQQILQQQHIEFISTREPGGTPIAEALRTLWKEGIDGEHTTDKAELLMMYASRTQLVETVIQPALADGKWVIGDRHDMSTQAYQGGGRGLDIGLLNQLKQAILGDFEPDFTLYLDIDPRIGLERAKGRGALDRIEQQHIDFFDRARARYLALVQNNPKAALIKADQTLEQVTADIQSAVKNWINSL
ncbi:thymidylate kinase [Cricetibacter osteomyelitidis]|uniref:Thymidylate kinase n=1 Tax=Cricetibacter osteomyelitidis TaxID=1521931 RepID=A0A4R2T1X9_9PAST|nr:dTMP kinase [Cricetibacter osteomyelitidis]TCP96909.1 thymidylate kinase [Cricetibacter osteomyelitidis]